VLTAVPILETVCVVFASYNGKCWYTSDRRVVRQRAKSAYRSFNKSRCSKQI